MQIKHMICRPFRLLRLEIFFSVLVYPFPACHQNEEKNSVLVSFSEHFRSGSVLVSTFFFWFLLWFPSGILYSKTKRLMTTSNKTDFSFFLLLFVVSVLVPACSWPGFPFWFQPERNFPFWFRPALDPIFFFFFAFPFWCSVLVVVWKIGDQAGNGFSGLSVLVGGKVW